jgi:hypothetical protein
MPIAGILGIGRVFFPGGKDTLERDISIKRADFIARIEEIKAVAIDDDPHHQGRRERAIPSISYIARYCLPSAGRMGRYRYTTIIVDICPKGQEDQEYPGFDGSEGSYPADSLELIQTIFSGDTT